MTVTVNLEGKNESGDLSDVTTIVRNGHVGIPVFVEALETPTESTRALVNPVHGIAMNKAVSFTGTPDFIHDGSDTTAWTGSALSGTWDFTSTTHAGQAIVTVVDYTALAGDSVTVNGTDITNTTLTAGSEWTAATSNTATATSLASALDGVAGINATSTGAVVEVTVDNGGDITTFTTTDGTNLPGSAGSIDATGATKNKEAQLERSSTIDTGDYAAVSLQVYLTSLLLSGVDDIELRFRLAGVDVGNTVNVSGFIVNDRFNVWQSASIEITAFGNPGVVDQLVIKQIASSGAPDYFLDKVKLQESTGFLEFFFAPEANEVFTVTKIGNIFVDNVTKAQAETYNKIMGVTKLNSGILAFFESNGVSTGPVALLTQLNDFSIFPQVAPLETYGDGTNTTLKIVTNFTFILDGRNNDRFVYRIQDDLSSLIDMAVFLFGTTETV